MLTEHQIRRRRSGIGASECATAAGYNPYATPIDLYNAKVFGIEQAQSYAMRAGSFFEDGIAKIYELELGGGLARDPAVKIKKSRTRRHHQHRFMLATIDREVYRHGVRERIVEIKLPNSRYAYNRDTGERELVWGFAPDAIPSHVACQAQWQLSVINEQRCDVVAFFLDTKEIAIYPQLRDQPMIDALVEINRAFWYDHIVPCIPPSLDGSEGASRFLRRTFPRNTGGTKLAPPHAEAAVREYKRAGLDEADAKERTEYYGNQLKNLIGNDDGLAAAWGKVTWKLDSRGRVDWKKLAGTYRNRLELLASACDRPDLAADLDDLEDSHRDPAARRLYVRYDRPIDLPADQAEPELQLVGGVA